MTLNIYYPDDDVDFDARLLDGDFDSFVPPPGHPCPACEGEGVLCGRCHLTPCPDCLGDGILPDLRPTRS
jgi:hypothetical protein